MHFPPASEVHYARGNKARGLKIQRWQRQSQGPKQPVDCFPDTLEYMFRRQYHEEGVYITPTLDPIRSLTNLEFLPLPYSQDLAFQKFTF